MFAHVTSGVAVSDDAVADYHARNPRRFVRSGHRDPQFAEVRERIAEHLLGAARRRAFRRWLDERRAALVWLAPGYEHPGDPRQPDNTHKH